MAFFLASQISSSLRFTGLYLCIVASVALSSESLAKERTLPDPTRPLGFTSSPTAVKNFNLQAIFFGDGRKEAIINGQSLTEGEFLGNYRIKRITAREVHYQLNGKTYIKSLRPSIFKKN